jgi:hypothetical protein
MKFHSNAARCVALAAGALFAACSGTGSSSPVPPPHQSFGSGSDWSVQIFVTNAMSGEIGPHGFSNACWRISSPLAPVAPGTTSRPVRLYVNPNTPGCNPPPDTQIVYSYSHPGGQSSCGFLVGFSGPGPQGPADFAPYALGAATCTARWSNNSDGEVLTYAPK